jgi:hypothetical protein
MTFLAGGCSAPQTGEQGDNPLALLSGEKPAVEAPADGPSVTVEMRREGYSPQISKLPHAGTMHLQEALEKTGVTKKLKNMELYVLRTPPQGGPRQRLTAKYDSGDRRVAWESDYALYPGDYVVVIENATSEFDRMVGRFLGPFGAK